MCGIGLNDAKTNNSNVTDESNVDNSTYKVSQTVDLSKSKNVTKSQGQQLLKLVDKYEIGFVGQDKRLGECDRIPYRMEIDPRHKPIRKRYYQLGPKQKEALEGMILEMEEQDIIERSTSPWGVPVC